MRLYYLLFFLLLFSLTSCGDSKNNFTSLNGDWLFSEINDTIWLPANVPGTVQTDLLKLGKIPNPFIGNNEDSIQWVSEKTWQYKKHFSINSEIIKNKKHILQLEGLDTYASVFLNDSLILKSNNAFRRWEIDISAALQSKNELLIQFHSIDSIEKNKASVLAYTLPEAPRVFTRKPQFQYGWDWGPKIKTIGIWKDVSIISYSTARCTDVFLQTQSITDSVAKINAKFTIETLKTKKINIKITNQNTQETFNSIIEISPNKTQYNIPFSIKNPKLWWTHNLGEPFLYDFKIEILDGKNFIKSYTKKLGIRSIELVTEKDSIGENFYFKLNGKPVYMKGANYIPQNIFLPNVTQEQKEQLLNDAVKVNMNMLRVWGGGVYEDSYFYQLCDAKGILVWQDFMFACAMYPGDSEFLENVTAEAIENVKKLRQHPSIALWCGNNENSEGWNRWGWQDGKTESQKQEVWSNYNTVFNNILPKVLDSLHPSISYWESSPKYGRGDKRFQFEGDAHDWWVWHDGYPFEHFEEEVPRFMSEFGFQSFPSFETIKYFTQQDNINISHPAFETHQKHKKGFQRILEYMERDFPVPTNDEDYVYVSQLLQAYGITKGIHAHRRAKPYNMGTLYWQLNDCWPAVSWSSIDGLGNWKALHYNVKNAFANMLISAINKNGDLNIYLINDSFSEIKETLTITHLDFFGNVLSTDQKNINCMPNSNEIVYNFPLKQMKFDMYSTFLKLNFGEIEQLYYFVKPKELSLKNEDIKTNIEVIENGFVVTLISETLQKDIFLNSSTKGRWSDNFFDLLPNKPKTIMFATQSKNPLIVEIKTLNKLINK
jgi:beta-mannosidase